MLTYDPYSPDPATVSEAEALSTAGQIDARNQRRYVTAVQQYEQILRLAQTIWSDQHILYKMLILYRIVPPVPIAPQIAGIYAAYKEEHAENVVLRQQLRAIGETVTAQHLEGKRVSRLVRMVDEATDLQQLQEAIKEMFSVQLPTGDHIEL